MIKYFVFLFCPATLSNMHNKASSEISLSHVMVVVDTRKSLYSLLPPSLDLKNSRKDDKFGI